MNNLPEREFDQEFESPVEITRQDVRHLYKIERREAMQRALNLGCILALILVPAFGVLDYMLTPQKLGHLLAIRLICSLNIMVIFFLNKSAIGENYANYLAIYGATTVAASIALMTYVLGGPTSPYYAGINLAVIVAGLITPLTVLEGIITCLLIYFFYFIISIPFLHGEAIFYYASNSFFMIATMIVVVVGFRLKEVTTKNEIQKRLQLSAMSIKLEEYSKNLENRVRERTLNIIQALAYAIEAKDPYTRGHSERVKNYAVAMAKRLALPKDEILQISYAAILHDVGKVEISPHILEKPKPLTKDEYTDIKEHPVIGEIMVEGISFLREAKRLIRHHHERWDGEGYPEKLKGEEIPLGARIITIADTYDAMIFQRPYRKEMSKERVILKLREEKGKSLDPNLVEAFIDIIREME